MKRESSRAGAGGRTVGRWTVVLALLVMAWSPARAAAQQDPDPFGDELAEIAAEEKVIEEIEAAERAEGEAAARALAAARAEAPVTDPTTGLQWTSEARLFEGAFYMPRLHCLNLVAGGKDDWRLPDVEELQTIVGRLDELGIRGEPEKLVSGEIKKKTVSSIGVNADNFQPNEEFVMYVFVPRGKIRQTSVENRLDKKGIGVLCVRP